MTLVDLPTFPRGTVSLSLPYIAGIMQQGFDVRVVDLNFRDEPELLSILAETRPVMVGMKVSAQNRDEAVALSARTRSHMPGAHIVWGGEYPSLLPDLCAEHADTVVCGLFDTVAEEFMADLARAELKPRYTGSNDRMPGRWAVPDWSWLRWEDGYSRFMGLPLETTRGCTESCTFCMVLVMQRKHYHTRPLEAIEADIRAIGRDHINIIDYNFGVDAGHVKAVCDIIARSQALGFMAEMCIELLDDESVLDALASARCRMVYCGLESLDQTALKSVGKHRTNNIASYRRIIAKAHGRGIRVASGFILGMEGTTDGSYREAVRFFTEVGIMYVKLTYLTFNPGTRSKDYYGKRGTFITEDHGHFDGNRLTYLPPEVTEEGVAEGVGTLIRGLYSPLAILRRSWRYPGGWQDRLAFICFNWCYAQAYRDRSRFGPQGDKRVPATPVRDGRPLSVRIAERLLLLIWSARRG